MFHCYPLPRYHSWNSRAPSKQTTSQQRHSGDTTTSVTQASHKRHTSATQNPFVSHAEKSGPEFLKIRSPTYFTSRRHIKNMCPSSAQGRCNFSVCQFWSAKAQLQLASWVSCRLLLWGRTFTFGAKQKKYVSSNLPRAEFSATGGI